MKFTRKERIYLINQYKILALLEPDSSDHYEEIIEILENGYEIFYSTVDEWVAEDMPSDQGKFVLEILDFYRAIEDLKRNTNDQRLLSHPLSFFRGFDGNNETEYMGFARFLINKQGKFQEQQDYLRKNDNLNSHSEMKHNYSRILEKWEEKNREWKLSVEDAIYILG